MNYLHKERITGINILNFTYTTNPFILWISELFQLFY